MNRYLLFALIFSISGCVSFEIKAPDTLVPDVVDVGKEAYQTLKEQITGEPTADEQMVFLYRYSIVDGESEEKANKKCIEFAYESARKKLNIYNINASEAITGMKTENNETVVECSISVST